MRVAGAVLCGGRSSRMGTDKALVEVAGVAMAVRVARALADAGCVTVSAVGGDSSALEALGLSVTADEWPGEGPLAGIVAALRAADEVDAVAVMACDMPYLSAASVRKLVDGLAASSEAAVAVAITDRLQPLCAVWRRSASHSLASMLQTGERRMQVVLAAMDAVHVSVNLQDVANMNTPADLPTSL